MARRLLPGLRPSGHTAMVAAVLFSVAACGPQGGFRSAPPGSGGSGGGVDSWSRRSRAPLVEPDLEPIVALTIAARVVLDRMPLEERRRVLAPYVPFGPQPSQWSMRTGYGGVVEFIRQALPEVDEVDLQAVMRLHYDAHGQNADAALAALFVGAEPVARAKARLRKKHPVELRTLKRRLRRAERKALKWAEEALPLATVYGLRWPVSRGWRVTSSFGPRWHPVSGRVSNHRGVDLGVPMGTDIYAPAEGVVRRVRVGRANGKWLEVDHGAGVRTMYCHLSEQLVKRGQEVKAGELLARSGDTGRVTGPHLHYQLKFDGEFVDPIAARAAPSSAEGLIAVMPHQDDAGPSQTAAMR